MKLLSTLVMNVLMVYVKLITIVLSERSSKGVICSVELNCAMD